MRGSVKVAELVADRKAARVRQVELAKALGTTRHFIMSVEGGEVDAVDSAFAARYRAALDAISPRRKVRGAK